VTVIVVGGGIVGCAIAYELSCRGAAVRIVDTRGIARGATRASAGMLAPYIEGHLGPLRTIAVRSLALYDQFVARVTEDSGESIEYDRSGTLQVAHEPREYAELSALAQDLAGAGVAHALLGPDDALRFEPRLGADMAGGLAIFDHGYVAAGALTRGLAAAAAKRGATIDNAHVLAIDGGTSPRVVTSTGTLECDAVVVAAGSWAGALENPPGAPGHVKPVRGQLVELRLPERAASRIVWGSQCYVVPWLDGTALVGATAEDAGFNESATVAGVRMLLDASAGLLPALASAAFVGVRVGLRPMTADELPVIGASSTMRQVFYATGHYRNGILLAPLTAMAIAELVLDGRHSPDLAAVRPERLGL
jgi:glycine oxidase